MSCATLRLAVASATSHVGSRGSVEAADLAGNPRSRGSEEGLEVDSLPPCLSRDYRGTIQPLKNSRRQAKASFNPRCPDKTRGRPKSRPSMISGLAMSPTRLLINALGEHHLPGILKPLCHHLNARFAS